jgi:PAS domain S-box-containing protein
MSIILRYQVNRKTKELKETNKSLWASEHEARLALNTIEVSSDLSFWSRPSRGIIRVNKRASEVLGYTKEEFHLLPPRTLIPEDRKEEFESKLELSERPDVQIRFETELLKKSGDRVPVEISLDRFTFEGIKYTCGFARDISEHKKALKVRQELMANLAIKNKELNCLYAVSKLISDDHKSIESILHEAVNLVPMSWQYPEIACARIKCDFGEFVSTHYKKSEWKIEAEIITYNVSSGSIEVMYKEEKPQKHDGPFSIEERNLIDMLGELLGNMLNVKGAEHQIIASIMHTEDRERKRISKEIHDSLGQTLSAISLNMDKVGQDIVVLPKQQQERFTNLTVLINQAASESRNIAHNLMPSTLNDFGYSSAVENMLDAIRGAADTEFRFNTNYESGQLSQSTELGLYRVTQEAVNNIIKHAKAKSVVIQLMCYPDIVILTIEDDGIGFDLKNISELSKFGLRGMENRARSLNAEFNLDSEPNKGTTITLQIHIK